MHNKSASKQGKRLKFLDEECSDESVVSSALSQTHSSDEDFEDGSFISDNDDVEQASTGDSSSSDGEVEKQQPTGLASKPSLSTSSIPAVTKKRGRPPIHPPKNSNSTSCTTIVKPPGHHTFSANEFSLTITKTGGDVELYILEKVHDFIVKYALKGGVSTEVGHRVHNLHLQGMFIMRYPKDKKHLAELVKLIKELIKPLTGYKVMLKPFATNQSFSAMLGYITKDQGEFSFRYDTAFDHNFCSYQLRTTSLSTSFAQRYSC